jgi:subtilisin family serine protease
MMEFLQEPVNLKSKRHFAAVASLVVVVFLLIAIPLTVMSVFKSGETTTTPKAAAPAAAEAVADEILVKFKPDVAKNTETSILNEHSLTVKSEIPHIGVKVLKVNPAARDAVIAALSKRKEVDYAEKNQIRKVSDFLPNDPYWKTGYKWELTQGKIMYAPEAWGVTTGSPSVSIAILDTGVDVTHEDLIGKVVASANFTSAATAGDVANHGTHVAGTAAANTNNSMGVASIGFSSTLFNTKVCEDQGYCYDSSITKGITWAADNGAKVINMSFGGVGASSALEDAVNYAWSKGVVLVGAAGNYGNTTLFYPAASQNVIAVAATDVTDQLTPYSNRGEWVDVAAPGDSIWSTVPNNGYNYKAGTSMAAPEVAGLAGLVLTRVTDTNGDGLLNDEVRTCIQTTAEDPNIGGVSLRSLISNGRINAYKAVLCSGSPGDTTPPTVSITSPTNGSTVSGSVSVAANATDNVGVARVEFYVDGNLKNTDSTLPYSWSWDSTTVANGSHAISAKAFDAAGNSALDSVTVTVANGDTTPPSTPTSLTASAAAYNRVNLSWTAGTDNVGVTGYWIVRNGTTIASSTINSYSDTNVSPSTTYNYQVIAYDAAGNNSGPSNTATVTTPAAPDTQPPTAPTNLTATAISSSQINLAWTASTDNIGVTGYEVYRNSTKVATVITTSFGDTGLAASTTYSYFVKARDAAGNVSTSSNTASATTQPPPPAVIGNITGTVSSSAGGVLTGAKISLTVNGSKKTDVTNSLGVYTITNLPAGTYSLKFSAQRYITQTVSVTVTANTTVTKNITLQKR